MHDLPDWGKLLFPASPPGDLAAALPGAPPAAVDLLAQLLVYDPQQRLPAAQALQHRYFSEEPAAAAPEAVAALVARAAATRQA